MADAEVDRLRNILAHVHEYVPSPRDKVALQSHVAVADGKAILKRVMEAKPH